MKQFLIAAALLFGAAQAWADPAVLSSDADAARFCKSDGEAEIVLESFEVTRTPKGFRVVDPARRLNETLTRDQLKALLDVAEARKGAVWSVVDVEGPGERKLIERTNAWLINPANANKTLLLQWDDFDMLYKLEGPTLTLYTAVTAAPKSTLTELFCKNNLRVWNHKEAEKCAEHLKGVGSDVTIWSFDHQGQMPETLAPILAIERDADVCPATGQHTYLYTRSADGKSFTLRCSGANHKEAGMPSDTPVYDSVKETVSPDVPALVP